MPVTLGPELEPAATQRGLELLHGAQGLCFCPQLVMPYLIFIHPALLLFIRTDSSAVKQTVVSLSVVEWSDERIDFSSRSRRSYLYIMFSQSKEKRKNWMGKSFYKAQSNMSLISGRRKRRREEEEGRKEEEEQQKQEEQGD